MSKFIVGDWGSSNIRMFLFDNNKLIDSKRSDKGITVIQGNQCELLFKELCSDWFTDDNNIPITLCGMVGSINGWIETPYLNCPINLKEIHKHLCTVKNQYNFDIKIIPGLCVNKQGNFNIMRGEETQLMGVVSDNSYNICIMPGTHCKWVLLDGSTVVDFKTAMIGEMHKLFMEKSLIGAGTPLQEKNENIFLKGLQCGFDEGNVIFKLFECRAIRVLQKIPPQYASEFLSGLLIGSELNAITNLYGLNKNTKICIVGNSNLANRYMKALNHIDLTATIIDGDKAFLDGIKPIANLK